MNWKRVVVACRRCPTAAKTPATSVANTKVAAVATTSPIRPFDAVRRRSIGTGPSVLRRRVAGAAGGPSPGREAGSGRRRSRQQIMQVVEGEDALHVVIGIRTCAARSISTARMSGARARRRCRSRASRPRTAPLARRSIAACAAPARRCPGAGLRDAGLGRHDDLVDEPAEPELAQDRRAARRPSSTPRRCGPRAAAAGRAPARRPGRGETGSSRSSASVQLARAEAARGCGQVLREHRRAAPAQLRQRGVVASLHVVGAVVGHLREHRLPRLLLVDLDPVRGERAPAAAATAARARPACRARRTARPRTGRRSGAAPAGPTVAQTGGGSRLGRGGALRPRARPTASTRTGMPFRCAIPASRSRSLGVGGRELVDVGAARLVGELPAAAVTPAVRQRDRARRHLVRDRDRRLDRAGRGGDARHVAVGEPGRRARRRDGSAARACGRRASAAASCASRSCASAARAGRSG